MFCLGVFKYIKIFQVQKHLFFSIGVARRAMVPYLHNKNVPNYERHMHFFVTVEVFGKNQRITFFIYILLQ